MEITLIPYRGETDTAAEMIVRFWQAHNDCTPSRDEALDDLQAWTKNGHALYFIQLDRQKVGFVHLGSRGCEADWLEDLFVLPEHQGKGIASQAIALTEEIVKAYSECLYIEVAARNERALRLYHRCGYTCLNTVTIRKDFKPDACKTLCTQRLMQLDFDVKTYQD